jgi:hypothetical protein
LTITGGEIGSIEVKMINLQVVDRPVGYVKIGLQKITANNSFALAA